MSSSSRNARAFLIALSLVIVVAGALWVVAVNDTIELGPGCAATFSC